MDLAPYVVNHEDFGMFPSWWFQPIHLIKYWSTWKCSPNRDENKNCLKPPPSFLLLLEATSALGWVFGK